MDEDLTVTMQHEESKGKLDELEGTTNVVLIVREGILVGVDSRSKKSKDGPGYKEGDIVCDHNEKLVPIKHPFYATMCGKVGLSIRVCEALQNRLSKRAHWTVEEVAEIALRRLSLAYEAKGEESRNLIMGYNDQTPECYIVHKDLQHPKSIPNGNQAIGAGAIFIGNELKKRHKLEMPLKEACDLTVHALTLASLMDHGTGGYLNVYHISPKEHKLVWRGLVLDKFYDIFQDFEDYLRISELGDAFLFISNKEDQLSGPALTARMRASKAQVHSAVSLAEIGSPKSPSGYFLYLVVFSSKKDSKKIVDEANVKTIYQEITPKTIDQYYGNFGGFNNLRFECYLDMEIKGIVKPIILVEATKANIKELTRFIPRLEGKEYYSAFES